MKGLSGKSAEMLTAGQPYFDLGLQLLVNDMDELCF